MNKNEKKKIYSYQNKEAKSQTNKRPIKIINKTFFINHFDILENLNNSNLKSFKKIKEKEKEIKTLSRNSPISNNKSRSLFKSNKVKILNDMNFIKNKIYSEKKTPSNLLERINNKNNDIKKKLYLNSLKDILIEENNSNSNKNSINKKKKDILLKSKINKNKKIYYNFNYSNIQSIKKALNEELKYLQKQYYIMDQINDREKNKKYKKYNYFDYADKNMVYNHPQFYFINIDKKLSLPKIDFSIKKTCLTEAIPDKTELINKSDFKTFNEYFKMKKNKKPLFIP